MSAPGGIAAVAIGRNEGERLVRCLASLRAAGAERIVYVDSGSTDGSVSAAEAAGAQVVTLDVDVPFTAARARNAGFAALTADGAAPAFVQFVDGDCELAPGWIATAAAFLKDRPDAALACGRRREQAPENSIYNRMCDMEWNTPVGEAAASGGDFLIRREAYEAVGGFDPTLIAGEEPEMCLRLRRAGWRIHRLDAEMTLHDVAMTRFGQWWRRILRSGWAYAEGEAMYGDAPEAYCRRETRSIRVWTGTIPLAILVALAAAAVLAAAGAPAPAAVAALAGAAGLALYPAMALRIALGRRRRVGDPWPDALAYGALTMIGKFAQSVGGRRYRRNRRAGGPARIIEYKSG